MAVSSRIVAVFVALCSLSLLGGPVGAQEGGTHLIITYQAEPQDRPALWEYAHGPWQDRLEGWRGEGIFQSYRILFNSYVDDHSWDVMLVLRFDDYGTVERWNDVEKQTPAGLDESGLRLAIPDHTYLANLRFHGMADDPDRKEAVYFVIPYEYASEAEYERYAQVYVLPQLDGWIGEGILNGYEILLNRHPTGKPWDVLFLLEYRNTSAFALRDDVKWGVREGLQEDPGWKLVSDNKHDFRIEGETVIAEPLWRVSSQ